MSSLIQRFVFKMVSVFLFLLNVYICGSVSNFESILFWVFLSSEKRVFSTVCCFSNKDNNIYSYSTFKASHMVMSNFKVSGEMHFLSISWEKRTKYWLIIYMSSTNSELFLETDLKKQVSASEPPHYSFFTPFVGTETINITLPIYSFTCHSGQGHWETGSKSCPPPGPQLS